MKKETVAFLGIGLGILFLATRTKVGKSIVDYTEQEVQAAVHTISDSLVNLFNRFEGLRLEAYQDPAGYWTIGYGHLIKNGDGFYHPDFNPSGRKTITPDEARALLAQDTETAQECIDNNVKVLLSENQKAALISFVYNLGCGAFTRSDLLKLINQGNFDAAAEQFSLFVHAHDATTGELVTLPGLVTRREEERQIFTA